VGPPRRGCGRAGRRAAARARLEGAVEFLVRRREPTRSVSRTSRSSSSSSSGVRVRRGVPRYAPSGTSASPSSTTRTRPPRTPLPDLVTQRLLKAALAGRSLPTTGGAGGAGRPLHRAGERRREVERQVRKSRPRCFFRTAWATGSTASSRAQRRRTWCGSSVPRGRKAGPRLRAPPRRRQGAVKLLGVDVERGFIDFARRVKGEE